MDPEIDPKLEAILHEELRKLPVQSAPRTLAPRIMAAIRARTAPPWWLQAWWHWPLAAKAAFLVLALSMAGVATGGSWLLGDGAGFYFEMVAGWFSHFSAMWENFDAVTNPLLSLWGKSGEVALLIILATGFTMYLLCMGVGTAFVRVALRRT